MCACIKVMVGKKFVEFVIRAGGDQVTRYKCNVFDARTYFEVDRFPEPDTRKDMQNLKNAVEEIRKKVQNLEQDPKGYPRLYVQCKEGRSRSARCVGAFLVKVCNFSRTRALSMLEHGYKHGLDECIQRLSKDNVDAWLKCL